MREWQCVLPDLSHAFAITEVPQDCIGHIGKCGSARMVYDMEQLHVPAKLLKKWRKLDVDAVRQFTSPYIGYGQTNLVLDKSVVV